MVDSVKRLSFSLRSSERGHNRRACRADRFPSGACKRWEEQNVHRSVEMLKTWKSDSHQCDAVQIERKRDFTFVSGVESDSLSTKL
jgi:hypothetical protein